MIAIGTKILANDGYSKRLGEVVNHETNRWGDWHVVAVGDGREMVGTIDGPDAKGIGWKVATEAEIARAARYAAAEEAEQSPKTFRNANFDGKRNYNCTNIVACQGGAAPDGVWVECGPEIIAEMKLSPLWIQGGVRFFGWL